MLKHIWIKMIFACSSGDCEISKYSTLSDSLQCSLSKSSLLTEEATDYLSNIKTIHWIFNIGYIFTLQQTGETRTVQVLQTKGWEASETLPETEDALLYLFKRLEQWDHTNSQGNQSPVLVVCRFDNLFNCWNYMCTDNSVHDVILIHVNVFLLITFSNIIFQSLVKSIF